LAGYKVLVDDNFHYMDESERCSSGEFETYADAVRHCQRIVDAFLQHNYRPGMAAEELYKQYTSFGDDPFIVPPAEPRFSAWAYAKQRCQELCAKRAQPGNSALNIAERE
jgi:hypothetical protein